MERAKVPPPTFAVAHLLGPCWPQDASGEESVVLTLIRDGGKLRDIFFETKGGATNAVGRCLRQVLWEYPWRGDIPETIEVTPPSEPPHGWATLEHIRLLSSASFGADRGVLDPIPLVQACVRHGGGLRPGLVFAVRTQPVRVFALAAGIGSAFKPTEVVSGAERCVQAVLSSTVYPGSRSYILDFSRGTPPGEPAALAEVAQYLDPAGAKEATGNLDFSHAKAALQGLQPAIGACWEATLNRRAGVSGARTFRIRVEPSGKVAFAQVIADRSSGAGTEAVDYLLDRCIADAVRSAKIPPPEGGAAEFAYSWVFALRQ